MQIPHIPTQLSVPAILLNCPADGDGVNPVSLSDGVTYELIIFRVAFKPTTANAFDDSLARWIFMNIWSCCCHLEELTGMWLHLTQQYDNIGNKQLF